MPHLCVLYVRSSTQACIIAVLLRRTSLLLANFVVKVFWSTSARGRPENDSCQAWIARWDSPGDYQRRIGFYQPTHLSDVRVTFATKSDHTCHNIVTLEGCSGRNVTLNCPQQTAPVGMQHPGSITVHARHNMLSNRVAVGSVRVPVVGLAFSWRYSHVPAQNDDQHSS